MLPPMHFLFIGGITLAKKKNMNLNSKRITGGKDDQNKWIIKIILLTFVISSCFSFVSEVLLRNVDVLVAFIILVLIIMIGIIFDIIGVAVTAADETPFHSMSSRKYVGAKTSILLIRNASKISNFCNDVIGDICGIVSGAVGAVIAVKIASIASLQEKLFLTILLSSGIASLTVGGKALGKHYSITQSNNIVYRVGFVIEEIKRFLRMK
jgi:hypothetical protein